jgi:hypothetical protein
MQISMNLLTQFVYKQVNDWIYMDFMVYIYIVLVEHCTPDLLSNKSHFGNNLKQTKK